MVSAKDTLLKFALVGIIGKVASTAKENATTLVVGAVGAVFLYNFFKGKWKEEIKHFSAVYGIPEEMFFRIVDGQSATDAANIEADAQELKTLFAKYGEWKKAICAFYWGAENVDAAIAFKKLDWYTQVPANYRTGTDFILYG